MEELFHLIKQEAEKRTTRSWDVSIWNASREIQYINQRRKVGGVYITSLELGEIIAEAYPAALRRASLEVFEGRYNERELSPLVNRAAIEQKALELITTFFDEE